MIDEAPRADERPAALRQCAANAHRARAAERNVAGLENLDRGARAGVVADHLGGVLLQVAHAGSLIAQDLDVGVLRRRVRKAAIGCEQGDPEVLGQRYVTRVVCREVVA